MSGQLRTVRETQPNSGSLELQPLSAAFVDDSGGYGKRVALVHDGCGHENGAAGDACLQSDGAVDDRDRKMPTCWVV